MEIYNINGDFLLEVKEINGIYNLKYANLKFADLENADLKYANLKNADLKYANLKNANLKYANLENANLDFSSLSLWCGSFGLSLGDDPKLIYQLLYHICKLQCNHEDFKKIKELTKKYANKFHRVNECGLIK